MSQDDDINSSDNNRLQEPREETILHSSDINVHDRDETIINSSDNNRPLEPREETILNRPDINGH